VSAFIYPVSSSEDQIFSSIIGTILSHPVKRLWIERLRYQKQLNIKTLRYDLFTSNKSSDFLTYYFDWIAAVSTIVIGVMMLGDQTEGINQETVIFGMNLVSLFLNCMLR